MVWLRRFHRAGLFAFRTLPVFDARAVFIAFSAALILHSRSTSEAGKLKAIFSLASARFKRSAFLVSEIGWPIKPSYAKTTPSEAALGSTDNPADKDAFNSLRRYAGSLSPSGGAATSNAFTTPHSIA